MRMTSVLTFLFCICARAFIAQPSSIVSQETYALIIGISDYQSEEIPDLKYAHKDAEAFASFIQSTHAPDQTHIKLLLNEEATLGKIAIAFDWLWENVKEGDKVYIYFSGHGDVEKKTISQSGYLLCWDAPARVYMSGGAFPVPILQDVISTLSLQNKADVLVITDACRAGKLAGSSALGPQITGSKLIQQYANETKLLSCQPDEYSIEGVQWGGGRGAFSYHLINGLYGFADKNKDFQISLKEIRNYLESKVTSEVAPNRQTPITVGRSTRNIVPVDPQLVDQINANQPIKIFSYIESKGLEDELVHTLDEATQSIFTNFKNALKNKRFFPSISMEVKDSLTYAEFSFQKLIKIPELAPLYSTIKRNYAAALQDDAQQVLNVLLKTGLTKYVLSNKDETKTFAEYPAYLQRAAELLGEDHYMYKPLQARKHFFIGKIENDKILRRKEYLKALHLQPEMPHTYMELVTTYDSTQLDSALYYGEKAIDLVPNWSLPYIKLYFFYRKFDMAKAKEMLDNAEKANPNSVYTWYTKARYLSAQGQLDEAERLFKKVLASSEEGICFPCAYNSLGVVYNKRFEYEKSVTYFENAVALDSNFNMYWANLGLVYYRTYRYNKAIDAYKKALTFNANIADLHLQLGDTYFELKQYDLALESYHKGEALDSKYHYGKLALGIIYKTLKQYKKSESYLLEALEFNQEMPKINLELSKLYCLMEQEEKAFQRITEAIEGGYDDVEELNKHPELQCNRDMSSQWTELLTRFNLN